MTTSQVTSININTTDPESINTHYPTLIYWYVEQSFDGYDYYGSTTYIYKLVIVYLKGKKREVDIFFSENDSPNEFCTTEPADNYTTDPDDINTIDPDDPDDIIARYPTLIYKHVKVSFDGCDYDGPSYYIYELVIVYLKGKQRMVDIFFSDDDSPYKFCTTKRLGKYVPLLMNTDIQDNALKRVFINGFIDDKRPQFQKWLGLAREKIVVREAHPDRVRELLESGVDLDDLDKVLESKLATKLSW